jgi:hypothetical protein
MRIKSRRRKTSMRASLSTLALSALFAGGFLSPAALAEDASVKARLDAMKVKFEVDADGDYKVAYSYKSEKRTQLVFVSGKTEEVGGLTIRQIFSPAGRASKDGITDAKAMELLKESNRNKLGSWEMSGEFLYFVIKVPDNLDATQLESAMNIAAGTADDMEMKLSGSKDEL